MTDVIKNIIKDYDSKKSSIEDLTRVIEALITKILKSHKVNFHLITSRTKDRDSFISKISKPDKPYISIENITDLSGIRIITYLEDEVDIVAKIIENEFDIDIVNSVDKRKKHSNESFGYLSLHYICKLGKKRRKLSEYKNLIDIPFEMQVRSILQHSWAEIEHDLGYKNSIPPIIKRSFSRVASLLEIADKEFVNIKRDIDKLTNHKKEIILNDEVLRDFIKNNSIVSKIDTNIQKTTKRIKNLNFISEKDKIFLHPLTSVKRLNNVDIFTIEHLKSDLIRYQNDISPFFRIFVDFSSIYGFDINKETMNYKPGLGYCIYLLPYIKILKSSEVDAIVYHKLMEFFSLDRDNPFDYQYIKDQEKEFKKSIERLSKQMYDSYKKLNNLRSA